LPPGCGVYLEDCTIDEIETALLKVSQMKNNILRAEINRSQTYALTELSRGQFRETMKDFIANALAV
jgi:hypothetical protein